MKRRATVIVAVLALQALSAVFFVSDILSSYVGFGTGPISWEMRELIEIGAASGLAIGVVFGALTLRSVWRGRALAEDRLRRASAAFGDLLAERFDEWRLTAAERDVALFALKGMSTAESAALRSTSEGTVKAQTAAIYRKAGVTGRPQLLSLFIEDLMRDDSLMRPASPEPAPSGLRQIGNGPPAALP